MIEAKDIVLVILTMLGTIGTVVAALVWGFKRLLTGMLDNMKANTDAIKENTRATTRLAERVDRAVVVGDERAKYVSASLERIERAVA